MDSNGFIRDWLITKSWSAPCDDLDEVLSSTGSPWGEEGRWVLTNGPDVAPLKVRLYGKRGFVEAQDYPVITEGGAMEWKAPGNKRVDTDSWRRIHVGHDGYADWSYFSYTPEYRHALMACELEVDQPEWRTMRVETTGPVQIWLNGALVKTFHEFGYMQPLTHSFPIYLKSGISSLLISTWQVAFREVRHIVRVAIAGLPLRVVIPSHGADEYKGEIAERLLNEVGIERWALDGDLVKFHGPIGLRLRIKESATDGDGVVRVLSDGHAALSIEELRSLSKVATKTPPPSDIDGDVTATMLDAGEIFLEIRVDDPATKVYRILRTARIPEKVRSEISKVDPTTWRDEVISHVAQLHPSSARALAKQMFDAKSKLERADLLPALKMITSRADCADFEAIGLVHVLHRIPTELWADGLRDEVETTLLDFKYWIEQPGFDAMCYFTENHQFVWHTAEHLIGDYFADRTFNNANITGRKHSHHGEGMALDWLKRKLEGGFSEFDSNAYLAIDTLALVSLVEFSPSQELCSFAEALLDKLLFSLAANSWRGIHGAAHGRSYTTTLRSSRFEETAPIMWALWGMGALNAAVLPVTTLITAQRYQVPAIIPKIAQALDQSWSGRQVYRGKYRFTSDLLERPYGSDLHIWRTENGMLSSVQDYRAGLPGLQEHIWGATLSSEVQVFSSYPAAFSHGSSVRPNAWAGHLILPRARQFENSLLCIYSINPDLLPNKTHLWFPTPWMDEISIKGSWLAGRVGDGYIAVSTQDGFAALKSGDTVGQEWIPQGDGALYVATLGDAKSDGPFEKFVAGLEEPLYNGVDLSLSWISSSSKSLSLSWKGAFLVDGVSADLDRNGLPSTPDRLRNPATTVSATDKIMRAAFGGETLDIDLIAGCRLSPKSDG